MEKHWRNDQWIENTARETIQNEAQKEKSLGKMSRLLFHTWSPNIPAVPGKEIKGIKNIFKNNGQNFFNFDENYKLIAPRKLNEPQLE